MSENKGFFERLFNFLKSIFLNGLFAIFPIAITYFVVNFAYNFMARWLEPLKRMEPDLMQKIPGSEFMVFIIGLMFIGVLLKFFIVGPIIHKFERIIRRIPIINTIYSGAKTLVDFFNVSDPAEVQRKVVLIKYPNQQYYNLAFLLGSAQGNFDLLIPGQEKGDEEYFKVFMPNTPNPSSGYFFILPQSAIIETDITFEEAIKTLVSCGLITPESLKR